MATGLVGSNPNCSYGVGSSFTAVTIPYIMDLGAWVGVFWSMVAFASTGFFIFGWFATRRVSFLMALWVGATGSLLNSVAVSKIEFISRPAESCIGGNGFPSGHAFNSFGVFTFILFETIFRPYWNINKKLLVFTTILVVLAPCGPARNLVRDHTWFEIGIGMACGAIWGFINWLFTRFIYGGFINERLQMFKVFRVLLVNDYDPDYVYSHWHGKLQAEKAKLNDIEQQPVKWNRVHITTFHVSVIICNMILGILGIIIASIKQNWDPNCDRAAPSVLYTIGCMTLFTSFLLTLVAVLIWFKLSKGATQFPLVLRYTLYVWGFFVMESAFWTVTGFAADSENCISLHHFDIVRLYLDLWFAWEAALIVVFIAFYFKWDMKYLYSKRKERTAPKGVNTSSKDIKKQSGKKELETKENEANLEKSVNRI